LDGSDDADSDGESGRELRREPPSEEAWSFIENEGPACGKLENVEAFGTS